MATLYHPSLYSPGVQINLVPRSTEQCQYANESSTNGTQGTKHVNKVSMQSAQYFRRSRDKCRYWKLRRGITQIAKGKS